tara:strand:+ start:7829 stop:8767 length:939 start_codon:yes stop_codon:yes gene_type:complete
MIPPKPRHDSQPHSVIVLGSTGLLGSAISRANPDCIQLSSKDFDATSYIDTKNYFRMMAEDIENSTIHVACGVVGGIAQQDYSMFLNNTKMTMNLLECIDEFQATGHTIYYSSSCVYPLGLDNLTETDVMSDKLDSTKQGYAFSKLVGIKMCEYLNHKRGFKQFTAVIPPNLWGDGDNWDIQTCHVLPAITQKIYTAHREGHDTVEIYGSSHTRREFLRSDDVVTAAHLAAASELEVVNVGSGTDISIGECVLGLVKRIGYTGRIVYTGGATGADKRLLDSTHSKRQGFTPSYNYSDMLDYMATQGATHGIS